MAYGNNYGTLQQGVGLLNTGRNLYNFGSWAANTAYPWLQAQIAATAPEAGAAAGAAAGAGAGAGQAAGIGAGAAGGAAAAEAATAATAAAGTAAAAEGAGAAAGIGSTIAEVAPFFASLFSDKRLKSDIRTVGLLDNGLPVREFRMGGGPMQIGLLAQDVRKVHPEAVHEGPGGLLMVNYGKATKPSVGRERQ